MRLPEWGSPLGVDEISTPIQHRQGSGHGAGYGGAQLFGIDDGRGWGYGARFTVSRTARSYPTGLIIL